MSDSTIKKIYYMLAGSFLLLGDIYLYYKVDLSLSTLVLTSIYIILVILTEILIQPILLKAVKHPNPLHLAIFLINLLATTYICLKIPLLLPFLPLITAFAIIYLSINSNLKTTITALIISLVSYCFLTNLAVVKEYFIEFIMSVSFMTCCCLFLAVKVTNSKDILISAQEKILTNSMELASTYNQLRAYTEVLEITSQELEKKTSDLTLINSINHLINSRLTADELKASLMRFIATTFEADIAWILIENMATGDLSSIKLQADLVSEETLTKPDTHNYIYATVFEKGEVVQFTNPASQSAAAQLFWTKQPVTSLIAIPLYRTEGILGALILANLPQIEAERQLFGNNSSIGIVD